MNPQDWNDARDYLGCIIVALLLAALLLVLLHFLAPGPQPIFKNISNNI